MSSKQHSLALYSSPPAYCLFPYGQCQCTSRRSTLFLLIHIFLALAVCIFARSCFYGYTFVALIHVRFTHALSAHLVSCFVVLQYTLISAVEIRARRSRYHLLMFLYTTCGFSQGTALFIKYRVRDEPNCVTTCLKLWMCVLQCKMIYSCASMILTNSAKHWAPQTQEHVAHLFKPGSS